MCQFCPCAKLICGLAICAFFAILVIKGFAP